MAIEINSIKYIPDLPGARALQASDLMLVNQQSVDASVSLAELAKFMTNVAHPLGSLLLFGDKGKDPNTIPEYQHQTWVRHGVGYTLRSGDDTTVGTNVGRDKIKLLADNLPQHFHNMSSNAQISQAGAFKPKGTVTSAGRHNHAVGAGAKASSGGQHNHDATISNAPNHQHEFAGDDQLGAAGAQYSRPGGWYDAKSDGGQRANFYWTVPAGGHGHTFTMQPGGEHGHDVVIPADGEHIHGLNMEDVPAHVHTITGRTDNFGSAQDVDVTNATTYIAVWKRTA